jgi:hypothetical protein
MRNQMVLFCAVADGVNIGIGCLHVSVDNDAAGLADLQAGPTGHVNVRPDAHCDNR